VTTLRKTADQLVEVPNCGPKQPVRVLSLVERVDRGQRFGLLPGCKCELIPGVADATDSRGQFLGVPLPPAVRRCSREEDYPAALEIR
jgi:hypothetical protein